MRFDAITRSPGPLGARLVSPRDEGGYLTDGRRLFRVVMPLRSLDRPDMAILEDCKTLNLVAFTADELRSLPLTPVPATRTTPG